MNMETLISSIINNISSEMSDNTAFSAKLSLSEFMPQGISIKTGDNLLLNLNDSGKLVITVPNGEKIELPPQALALDQNISLKPAGESVVISAKAGQVQNGSVRLQISTINEQLPQAYLRGNGVTKRPDVTSDTAAVIKDVSSPQKIPLQAVKVADVAVSYLKNLPVSREQQVEIQTALQQIEIKFQISSLSQENTKPVSPEQSVNEQMQQQNSPIMQKITNGIQQVAGKISLQPENASQIIQTEVQSLATELKSFIGTEISAQTTTSGLKSPLGVVSPEIPIQLPENIQAELELIDVILKQPQVSENQIKTSPLDRILQTIEPLKTENRALYQQITAHLPTDNEKMLSNMVAFTKAAVKGDVKQWLGQEVVQQLENQGTKGQIILTDLQNALQESSRQTPTWRIVEIPYYFENHMEKIKLAVKQYPDEEETEENPHQKFGTRFVVDTNFSQLGAFQFDGFSFAKDRRFDLIIRTQKHIDNDLCANIIRLFKISLNDVQYTGNININLKENFIKISENKEEDKFLAQGLFI